MLAFFCNLCIWDADARIILFNFILVCVAHFGVLCVTVYPRTLDDCFGSCCRFVCR